MDITSVLARYQGRQRDALLPVLWDVQNAFGHIGPDAVQAISKTLHVPPTEIYGVISFYSMFRDHPAGQTLVYLCTSPTCGLHGADKVLNDVRAHLTLSDDADTDATEAYTILKTTCLGFCDHAPSALICRRGERDRLYGPVTDVDCLLGECDRENRAQIGGDQRELLRGYIPYRVQTLADYGDYSALRKALTSMTPDQVIAEVEASGLIGRGGAAFSTHLKWRLTRQSPGQPHYIVCNADESEPGTFKDRLLLESQPHLLLEGLMLGGYAIGASKGYIFIRGEYPEAYYHFQDAIAEAQAAGILGERIMGSDFGFEIEIRRGAGAYICGEETALFEAIEGKRGFPRVKPPYPTTFGLFGKPTAVNNVETLCAIPMIIQNGGQWFRQWGTESSTGTKLVSVSGHVHRPGVYEIEPGLSLRELLNVHCQGVIGDLRAVLMGGAAGTFLSPDEIDVPLTFEGLRKIGSTFGSGAIMVFNQETDLRDVLIRLGRFFQHESCGKCFPCQLGTQRQLEILERLDRPLPGDVIRLQDIGLTMTEASLCGLGQTAASAVLSAIKRWPELFANGGQP